MNKELDKITLEWKEGFSCCVVASSGGYPEDYKGYEIIFNESIDLYFWPEWQKKSIKKK